MAKRRRRAEQDQVEVEDKERKEEQASTGLLAVPAEVWEELLAGLSDQDLCNLAQTCQGLRSLVSDAEHFWKGRCQARGWSLEAAADDGVGGADSWRNCYARHFASSCFECGQMCARTLTVGTLRVRLCLGCSESHAASTRQQRLITKADAASEYCLTHSCFSNLPYAVDLNPLNQGWAPMRLYRKCDVEVTAISKWGSLHAAQAERRRRILRRL
eukprot:jgi/Chlat1/3318/Chrsp22S03473